MKYGRFTAYYLAIVLSFILFVSSVNVLGASETILDNDEPVYPEVQITSPSDGAMLGEEDVEDGLAVRWSAGDPEGEIVTTRIELVGEDVKHVDTGNTVTFDDVETGSHEVIVTVWNDQDLSTSDSIELTVDKEVPELDITSPSDGESISNTTVVVSWTGDGGLSGIREYRVRVNREDPWINVGEDTSYELTELEEEDYLVEVEATDRAWNTNVKRVSFIVDGTPPTLTILSPSGDDAQISQSTFVTIMWSGRDDGSGIDYYEIRINGGQWRDVGRSTEYTFSGLFDGEHTVDIRAVDKAGNQQVERATFEVDPGSPSELFTMQLILLVMMVIAVIGLLTLVMFWKYHKEQRKFHKAEMLKESKKKPLKKKPLKRKDD